MRIGLKLFLRAVLSLLILLPAAIILTVGMISVFSFSSKMLSEEVRTVVYSQTSGLEVVFDEFINSIKFSSRLKFIKETAAGQYSNVQNEITSYINSHIKDNPDILDVIITDPNGVVCIDYKGREIGSLYSGFNEGVSRLGKNEVYISDISIQNSEYENKNTFYIVHQIRNEENTVGYISEVINTDSLSYFLGGTSFFKEGDMLVIDSKGTALDLNDTLITRFDEITNSGIKDLVSEIRGTRKNSVAKYENVDRGGFIGNYNNIGQTNWIWIGLYPNAAVTTRVSDTYINGFIMVSVITVIFFVLMLFITRMVFHPMSVMIKKMKLISDGSRNERFEINGSNEFARMASTFNGMINEVVISEELHRTISNLSDNMLFEWDFKKEKLYVSDNLLNIFKIDVEKSTLLNGNFIDSLMEKSYAENYKCDIARIMKSKSYIESEYQVLAKSGSVIWISMRAQCVTDRLGNLLRIIGVFTNIDSEKKLTLQLSERASYDFLSQLYNRSTFERQLQTELARSANRRLAVMFIDVDDFKFINDRYGHTTGDEVIKHVSKTIRELLGEGGFGGRFGGDEFVMCVTDENLLNNIREMATKFIDVLNDGYHSELADVTLNIKASIGIAIAPEHGKDGDTLTAAADEAMYYVKKNGKSNYHIYDPGDSDLIDMMHTI